MISGFQLRTLTVRGRGKQDAVVTFRPGLNVISGASNTGKSYILQCIKFMLGSSKKPKRIGEGSGYGTCLLELEDHAGQLHQLQRSLSGNAFSHKIIDSSGATVLDETLSEKNDPTNSKTVSGLLLSLTEAWGLKIRQTQAGKIRQVSFADYRGLTLIDEVRIISEGSPVFSGQNTTRGEETAFFKLLLTGVDDSSVIASESRDQSVARRKAQLELLDRLIPQVEREIADLDSEPSTLVERLERISRAVARQTAFVQQDQNELALQEAAQRNAWTSVRRIENKQANTTELRRRFEILAQHYQNDLNRLLAINEVDSFFSQLQTVRCPVCGSALDAGRAESHIHAVTDRFGDVQKACRAETAKIQGLMRDLVGTTQQLDVELAQRQENRAEQLSLFNEAARNLAERLSPAARASQTDLDQLLETRERLSNARVLEDRKDALLRERNLIAASTWQQPSRAPNSDLLVPEATESFSLKVEDLLRAWRYPGLTRVTFSDEGLDLLISGKERGSEGKGFRAIAYAAYIIGLLNHCADSKSNLPHPGLVVLDSPLVTYKRRDTVPGEEIPDDVTSAFYEALAGISPTKQIVVLENNDPPESLQSAFHYIHFSRSNVGRYGFFPLGDRPTTTAPNVE